MRQDPDWNLPDNSLNMKLYYKLILGNMKFSKLVIETLLDVLSPQSSQSSSSYLSQSSLSRLLQENFIRHVWKIEKVLKLWRMRNLTLEGKITIFKTLAISKIIHLSLVTNVPTQIIKELNKIQKEFIWNGSSPKIKHSTLCNKYENGGLKNVDILSKVISLQCSWIKRLYDN